MLLLSLVLLVTSAWGALSRGFTFMPEIDMNNLSLEITMPEGATREEAVEAADQVMERAMSVENVEAVGFMMGSGNMGGLSMTSSDNGDYDVTGYLTMTEGTFGSDAGREIEALCADLPCTVKASGVMSGMMSYMTGSGISLQVYGDDMEGLQTAARALGQRIGQVEGVKDVSDGLEDAAPALQVVVDRNDERFANPTKPIGPYYTKEQADRMAEADGSIFREDPKGNGWRKVVASPVPLEIINVDIVKRLAAEGNIVITAGGGGIPVYREEERLVGVEAVIDKDLASALTAVRIGADEFYILTDVPKVYVNFRKPDEKALDTITVAEAERYIEEKQFSEGSMLPKVKAALYFVRNGGKECVITDATQLGVSGGGTRIVP